MSHFEVFKSGQRQRTVPYLGGTMVIGRAPEAEILLQDMTVSRRHARVFPSEGRLVVEDLGTGSGTFVNGRREYRRPLADGDKIQLGSSYVLVWRQEAGEVFEEVEEAADPLARTIVDPGILARVSLADAAEPAGTSIMAPGHLARMRAEADARLGPHLLEERPSGSAITHALKHTVNVVGAGDRCQVRIPALGREQAASFERQPDGSFLVKKLGFFSRLRIEGRRMSKALLDSECRVEIQGKSFVFKPGRPSR